MPAPEFCALGTVTCPAPAGAPVCDMAGDAMATSASAAAVSLSMLIS
jgi:hypothetical protein